MTIIKFNYLLLIVFSSIFINSARADCSTSSSQCTQDEFFETCSFDLKIAMGKKDYDVIRYTPGKKCCKFNGGFSSGSTDLPTISLSQIANSMFMWEIENTGNSATMQWTTRCRLQSSSEE